MTPELAILLYTGKPNNVELKSLKNAGHWAQSIFQKFCAVLFVLSLTFMALMAWDPE